MPVGALRPVEVMLRSHSGQTGLCSLHYTPQSVPEEKHIKEQITTCGYCVGVSGVRCVRGENALKLKTQLPVIEKCT